MPSLAKSVSKASPVERRSYGRRRIDALTYLDLGTDNGAILVNLSEGGIGFQSVAPLEPGQTVILKFKAPGEKKHLESRAEVTWADECGKRGGLRFVELSADARAQIRAWADAESAAEAAPEIHRADTSSDLPASSIFLQAWDLAQPSPMGEISGPKSTSHANTPPEAPTRVASARPALPARSEIHDTAPPVETPRWVWREPYLAALREQNPFSLRERLLTAERAILSRMEALNDSPGSLPELQALREALNALYAREPNKSPRPPEIVEDQEEYDWGQRNWTTLSAVAALAALLSFAAGWVLASKSSPHNVLQSGGVASEPQENVASSDNVFASVPDVRVVEEPPPGSGPLQDDGAITPVPGEPSGPRVGGTMHVQRKAGERFLDVANAQDHVTPLVNRQTPEIAEPSHKSMTEGRRAENPSRQAPLTPSSQSKEGESTRRLVSIPPKATSEVRAEPQSIPSPSMAVQAKTTEVQVIEPAAQQPISQGSVTVSFSTYPSLRIPPELRSKAIGAKLQIGQVVSRIDPIYPEDAERQRIEGTVKLRAIIGTDGSVKGLEGMGGPPLLVPAAESAVRQWRYLPTLLSDRPIETAQDVTIVFRLSRNAASAN